MTSLPSLGNIWVESMNSPLVSVVIAVKNGERYLPQAIESVLAQSYDRHEIIVVDGGSTDGSVRIATSYSGVRCIHQTGQGFADAWNLGVEAAKGSLVAILDSDDWWTPEKLSAQVQMLESQPEVEYTITRMRFILEPGQDCPPGFKLELLDSDHIAYMPSALVVRKSVFEVIGGFDTSWAISSDIDWFARAKDRGLNLGVIPYVMLYKRVHDTNLSYLDARTHHFNREIVGLLKHSLDRQRARRLSMEKEGEKTI
jgi:glycosyltransferase involved in cell wall biosynthesis